MHPFDTFRPALLAVVVASCLAVLSGCGREPAPSAPSAPSSERARTVVVSIPPLAGLVEGLGGEGSEVRVLVPPGRTAHGFELSPADVATVGRADVVVLVGAGLDSAVARLARRSPGVTVIEFATLVGLDPEADHGHDHAEHAKEDHDEAHEGSDPHLWLDPSLCERLVTRVGEALGTPPEQVEARVRELRALDDEIRATLAPVAGRSFVTHHNSFSRLADRYGLTVAGVVRPFDSVEPTPGELDRVARVIRESGARAIMLEPQMPAGAARRLADLTGVGLGTLDPLGSGDYFAMMRSNAAELARALGDPQSEPRGP